MRVLDWDFPPSLLQVNGDPTGRTDTQCADIRGPTTKGWYACLGLKQIAIPGSDDELAYFSHPHSQLSACTYICSIHIYSMCKIQSCVGGHSRKGNRFHGCLSTEPGLMRLPSKRKLRLCQKRIGSVTSIQKQHTNNRGRIIKRLHWLIPCMRSCFLFKCVGAPSFRTCRPPRCVRWRDGAKFSCYTDRPYLFDDVYHLA